MRVTITARYAGTCTECGGRWEPGEQTMRVWLHATGSPAVSAWVHVVCPNDPTDASLRPGEAVCTTCWLVHPEGACDR